MQDSKTFRQLLLLRVLTKESYVSREEIYQLIRSQLGIQYNDRTFERDLQDIESTFGCKVERKRNNGYRIVSQPRKYSYFLSFMCDFELFKLTTLSNSAKPMLYFEPKQSKNHEYLTLFYNAITTCKKVTFNYFHTIIEITTYYEVEPLAIKEFKGRWYVIAQSCNSFEIKHFDLGRMSQIEFTSDIFNQHRDFDLEVFYKYSFGIVPPPPGSISPPEKIRIEVFKPKLYYFKEFPLHKSQETVSESPTSMIISLQVYPTYDLFIELLGHGNEIVVLSPDSVVFEMKNYLAKMCTKYGM